MEDIKEHTTNQPNAGIARYCDYNRLFNGAVFDYTINSSPI
jgi:hypothetical protein